MLIVNVDFFSSGRVAGWTNAKLIGHEKIFIKSEEGVEKDISDLILINRPDVSHEFNYEAEINTGFNINLFDLFNNRVKHFSIYVDDYEAWSSNTQLYKLEHEKNVSKKRFYEIGARRIIVIYKKDSWLDETVGRLHSWNYNQFNKSMNGGIAISFMNVNELRKNIKNRALTESNNIFLIERQAVRDSVVLSQDISTSPLIILEKHIDLSLDYCGLLNSVSFMNGFENNIKLTPYTLREMLETLVTYGELFFDAEKGTLLYVNGKVSKPTSDKIRLLNQEDAIFNGCIIVSRKRIKKLSDINDIDITLFVNSTLLKNVYDIVNTSSINFIENCLKRGIKVKNIIEGESL